MFERMAFVRLCLKKVMFSLSQVLKCYKYKLAVDMIRQEVPL